MGAYFLYSSKTVFQKLIRAILTPPSKQYRGYGLSKISAETIFGGGCEDGVSIEVSGHDSETVSCLGQTNYSGTFTTFKAASAGYFKVKIIAKDSAGNTSLSSEKTLNTGELIVFAGSTE